MLSIEDGAKYLVVAWVNDWSLRLLADVLDGAPIGSDINEERLGALVANFPFMPRHLHWYLAGRGVGISTRKFVADTYPALSNALFSADDNAKRLSYGPQIQRLKAGNARPSSKLDADERTQADKQRKEIRAEERSYYMSREAFRSNQRSAWNVCKG